MSVIPESIGRYKVLELLGQGAMGAVYLAHDPLLKRRLAIKVVKETGDQQNGALIRFQREAEISARLNDPNIITIYDVGEDPATGPFLAMEYVEGKSLGSLIRGDALDAEEAVRMLLQLAKALVAAEGAGVVHRDVKPENILVSKDGRLKLMDFGIAKGDKSKLTTVGMIVGTPSYTAPELLKGAEATPATDRYALAVTAFEMFSGGRMPHPGDTLGAILYHIVHEPPVIPEGMDPSLANVLRRALDINAALRYPDTRGFLQDLAAAARVGPTLQAEVAAIAVPSPSSLAVLPGDEKSTMAVDQLFAENPFGDSQPFNAPMKPLRESSGKLLMPKEPSSGMVQEDIPTEDALAAVNQTERRAVRTEPEESHAEIIPPQSLMRAASAASAAKTADTSAPRKMASAPGYRYTPPEPLVDAHTSAKGLPASFTNWAIGAGLLILALGGWAWHSATATRSLHVESFPPGAEVRVDGQVLGRTTLTADVKASAKEIILDLPYHNRETVKLKPNENPGKVKLRLWKDYTYVLSDPPNAEVYVDGAPKGQTPIFGLELPGASRRQQLVVKKDGYRSWSGTLEQGRPLTAPIRLVPESMSGDSGR
ncbi:MAG: serine/threonine protein kinase [Holophagaceae bacterium]|nr:serine/threonine protein kinase [Holophagaceae bacterium]